MKWHIQNGLYAALLMTALAGPTRAGRVMAQTDGTGFSTLYDFTARSRFDPSCFILGNSDGVLPSGLILSGDTLYGTAAVGGNGSTGATIALSLGADSSGIYAGGRADRSVKGKAVTDWIVRRSTNGGTTWTTVDDFEYPSSTSSGRFSRKPLRRRGGGLALARAKEPGGDQHLVTRR